MKRKALVLAPQVPWPPQQGAAVRNFHVLMMLARKHDVSLIAFGDPEADLGPLASAGIEVTAIPPPKRRHLLRRGFDLFTTPVPDLARRLDSETLRVTARLKALLAEPFEIVHVEGLEMAPFGLDVLRATPVGARAKLIYDAHNAEWVLQRRALHADAGRKRRWPIALYSLVQTVKLRRYEAKVVQAAYATVAVSEADAAALRQLVPGARILVAPNGVDTNYFAPGDSADVDADLCVFTGKMDFRPNIDAVEWFCENVWPAVRQSRPNARFAIVGRDPAPAVRALAIHPGVLVTGGVADVRPWVSRAGVVVAPLRVGGGTRLKVLEAMAMAKPVVATSMALEGLNVTPDTEVMVADTPGEMASTIVALAGDPDRRDALGKAARQRTEFEYRWESIGWRIEALYRDGLAEPA